MDAEKKPALKSPVSAVKNMVRSCGRSVLRRISDRHIRKLSKKKCTSSKIQVAFLVQMPELWIKIESVYERMNADDRFETCLIIVPAYDFANSHEGETYGDELQYFTRIAGNRKYIIAYEDAKWKDANSADLLRAVWKDITAAGWSLVNLDCVIKLERPKFLPRRREVIESVAAILGVEASQIFVKAKTGEKLPPVGTSEAVEAQCVCLLNYGG